MAHDAEDVKVKGYNRRILPKANKIWARCYCLLRCALPAYFRVVFAFGVLSHFCGVVFCLNILFRLNILLSV
jgi:hypothetical protein